MTSKKKTEATKKLAVDAGARIERDNEMSVQVLRNVCKKYLTAVTDNMELRFSDDVSQLGALRRPQTSSNWRKSLVYISAADISAE